MRSGRLRVITGQKFPRQLGVDVVGDVVRTGAGVSGYQPDDRVWGVLPPGSTNGTAAEYVAMPARHLSAAPENLDAAEADAIGISVDYRLAPEHPFPAAIDDALAVVSAVLSGQTSLGIDQQKVAVVGDSAGGNIAAVVSQQLRDHQPGLVHQGLIYPCTDLADLESESFHRNMAKEPSSALSACGGTSISTPGPMNVKMSGSRRHDTAI